MWKQPLILILIRSEWRSHPRYLKICICFSLVLALLSPSAFAPPAFWLFLLLWSGQIWHLLSHSVIKLVVVVGIFFFQFNSWSNLNLHLKNRCSFAELGAVGRKTRPCIVQRIRDWRWIGGLALPHRHQSRPRSPGETWDPEVTPMAAQTLTVTPFPEVIRRRESMCRSFSDAGEESSAVAVQKLCLVLLSF